MKQEKTQKQVKHTKKIEESLSYTVEVRDKEGRVIQRISAPSRSYVKQWNQMISTRARGGAGETIKDTGGVDRASALNVGILGSVAAMGQTEIGLRIGKGSTAVAIDDYALETPLEEGTGTDEFEHQPVTTTLPAVVGPTCSFTLQRIFVNNSGATISGIREIGCYNLFYAAGAGKYALGYRDVLPSAVYVPHGGSITVTYTMAVTV